MAQYPLSATKKQKGFPYNVESLFRMSMISLFDDEDLFAVTLFSLLEYKIINASR